MKNLDPDYNVWRAEPHNSLDDMIRSNLECQLERRMWFKTVINLQTGFWEILFNRWTTNHELRLCINRSVGLFDFALPGLLPPYRHDVALILSLLQDKDFFPIIFHCRHHRERTGFIAAVYRMQVQGWTFERAWCEWRNTGCRWIVWQLWKPALRKWAK